MFLDRAALCFIRGLKGLHGFKDSPRSLTSGGAAQPRA